MEFNGREFVQKPETHKHYESETKPHQNSYVWIYACRWVGKYVHRCTHRVSRNELIMPLSSRQTQSERRESKVKLPLLRSKRLEKVLFHLSWLETRSVYVLL